MSVLDHVLRCDVERERLLKEQHEIQESHEEDTPYQREENNTNLTRIFERLTHIEAEKCESKAIQILVGLGFSQADLKIPSKNFSGGWRMRLAIAKVIFCEPEILMLDEPTNHLDLDALIWLEDYIQTLDCTVLIVSHARDFLNATCEEIIYFFN